MKWLGLYFSWSHWVKFIKMNNLTYQHEDCKAKRSKVLQCSCFQWLMIYSLILAIIYLATRFDNLYVFNKILYFSNALLQIDWCSYAMFLHSFEFSTMYPLRALKFIFWMMNKLPQDYINFVQIKLNSFQIMREYVNENLSLWPIQ